MLGKAVFVVLLVLMSGCAANNHQPDAAASAEARAENDRLKSEASALRKAVNEQQAVLESLKQH
ncbi:MAG: hypothetical protein AUJ57_01575 [Zetaproteobacteria bacterium CG1_02_53_45]|nr:MAG: hypothetical protein AUJ57_01575 [Zetaproteobacteria bacterium CG1_02_53_45]